MRRSCACWPGTARCSSERGGGDAYVPIDLLPRHLIDAVVATEDRRFFKHWGLDPTGMIARGLRQPEPGAGCAGRLDADAAARQEPVPGLASARGRASSRSWCWRCGWRRGSASATFSSSISTGCTSAPGPTASRRHRGASSASRRASVTLVEAAMLAGMLKAPSKYSPASNPPMARERAHSVLAKMVEAGLLSPEEGEKAARAAPRFSESLQRGQSGVDYAVDAVLERLPTLVIDAGRRCRGRDHHRRRAAAPRPGAGANGPDERREHAPTPARPASC